MKNYYKVPMVVLMMSTLSACSVKTTASKNPTTSTTTTTTTSPVGSGTGVTPGTGGTGTTVGSCDGIARNDSTRCYYKNIPTIMASGGAYGQTWWSSTSFIASSGNSPGQFSTDVTFNVRIIPRSPVANALSTFGKTCSPYMMYASKLKVQVMVHKSGVSVGEVATLSAPLDTASNVWHFTVPATSQPLVMEVVNVSSDSRCKPQVPAKTSSSGKPLSYYGVIPDSCTSNPYLDIPVNNVGPTECVAFDIQYSTDETYDLPGSAAN